MRLRVLMAKPIRWCFWCARFREIMLEAPWSSFDLAMSFILVLAGGYLITNFEWLESTYAIYRSLSGCLGLQAYGFVCLIAGMVQMVSVLWPSLPSFECRLFARMGVCFCFVVFSLNQLANVPPPVGAITHFVLSGLSIWIVLRTSRGGG